METVRLLRSQLRNKNILRVVDADTVPLAERALQEVGSSPSERRRRRSRRRRRPNRCQPARRPGIRDRSAEAWRPVSSRR